MNLPKPVIVALFLFTHSLLAFSESSRVSLEQVLASTLAGSPELQQIDAAKAAELATALGAGLLADPIVSVRVGLRQGGGERGDNEIEATLTQPLRPSDIGARANFVTLIRESAETASAGAIRELLANTSAMYVEAWGLEQQRDSYREALTFSKRISKTLSHAATLGTVDQNLSALIDAQQKRSQALLGMTQSALLEKKSALARRSGLRFALLSESVLSEPALSELPTFDELLEKIKEDPRGEQIQLQILRNKLGQQVRVASQDRVSAIEPEIGFHHNDAGTDQLIVGLSLPLPLWNGNGSERASAEAALAAVDARLAQFSHPDFESLLRAEFDSSVYLSAKCHDYDQSVIPAFSKLVSSEEQRLAQGQGALFQLWEYATELAQARKEWIDCQREAFASRNKLLARAGLSIFGGR